MSGVSPTSVRFAHSPGGSPGATQSGPGGPAPGRRKAWRGFSLIELLVTIALVAALTGIMLPVLGVSRDHSQRLACSINTRQITTSMMGFSADHDGFFVQAKSEVGNDSLAYLHHYGYLGSTATTLCPSTRNTLDPALPDAQQLAHAARHAQDDTGGHSYETFHHFTLGQFPRFTINQARRVRALDVVPPEQSFIVLDADNDPDRGGLNGVGVGYNNLPDKDTNNHGQSGMNVAFLDGSARFVTADQWIRVNLEAGHMDGNSTDMVRAKSLYEQRLQWSTRIDGGRGLRYWLE